MLADFLKGTGHIGKAHAIRREELARVLGVSVREVKALAESERLAGRFVCYSPDAKTGGIYLAANDAERRDLMDQIERECLRRLRQRSALKRAMTNRGQLDLFA